MYQLSVLLPSAHLEKRERFLKNLQETASDFSALEIVICLDGYSETHREGNIVYCYAPPSKFRGSFFNTCWRNATGRFMLMANDDILFRTKGWDKLIPYDRYPDDIVVFGLKDNQYNENFFCHPIWSRKVMNIDPDLFEPSYQITKCDNTIFEIHPSNRRVYLPAIEIEHRQDKYDLKIWQTAYDDDNRVYIETAPQRIKVKAQIMKEIGMLDHKVMIGVCTGEYARRADFYDHLGIIERPANSIELKLHGPSIAYNRNKVVEGALIHNCTHVMFIDDDTICKPNIIMRLLDCNVDIVSGIQLARNFPHPVIMSAESLSNARVQLDKLKPGKLHKIAAAGLGAVLIKTDVFKAMSKPWFRLGELQSDQLQEDSGFFYRVYKETKYEVFCDPESPVGHIFSGIVRPIYRNDQWIIDYDTQGIGSVSFVPTVSTETKQ